mmetsp:Transcript_632/g.1481  ORF Transcript_632/g.1481 Transcript_632/m.1481 type:complete len:83 (+) Transcript_632:888-1136(+)
MDSFSQSFVKRKDEERKRKLYNFTTRTVPYHTLLSMGTCVPEKVKSCWRVGLASRNRSHGTVLSTHKKSILYPTKTLSSTIL